MCDYDADQDVTLTFRWKNLADDGSHQGIGLVGPHQGERIREANERLSKIDENIESLRPTGIHDSKKVVYDVSHEGSFTREVQDHDHHNLTD